MSKRNTVQMLEDDTVPQDYLPSYETAMAESMRQQRNSVNCQYLLPIPRV